MQGFLNSHNNLMPSAFSNKVTTPYVFNIYTLGEATIYIFPTKTTQFNFHAEYLPNFRPKNQSFILYQTKGREAHQPLTT